MGFGKSVIGLLTAAFLAAAVLLGGMEYSRTQGLSLSVTVSTGERIRCWQDEEGAFYAFLPGGTELSGVVLHPSGGTDVRLDGNPVTDGMTAAGFLPDKAYSLTCRAGGEEKQTTLTFLLSGGVPALYVDTASGSVEYIRSGLGNEESGALRLYSPEGQKQQELQIRSINSRGNATYAEPKGAYSITLSREADLLDMGQAEKWILLANAYDPTNLRNKIVLDFAREFGLAYTPECRWVDLYLNGAYEGLYLLTERNEVHPQRVDVQRGSSFLVSKELERNLLRKNSPYITLRSGNAIRIHHNAFDLETLTGILQSVENALLAPDGTDPVTGRHFTELIDMDSWARKYLVEEVFGNVDAGFASQYYYYDESDGTGKLYAGPVWDYDASMGKIPANALAHLPRAWPGQETPWITSLVEKEEFFSYAMELYQQEFLPLLEKLTEEVIEEYARQIRTAEALDRCRWQKAEQDWATSTARYLRRRSEFLTGVWIDKVEYCWITMYYLDGPHAHLYGCLPGEPYYDPKYFTGEDVLGWHDMETDEFVDTEKPVTESKVLYLKYREEPEPTLVEWIRASVSWLAPFGGLMMLLIILILRDRTIHPKERRLRHGRPKRDQIPS